MADPSSVPHLRARAYFPRGLDQPADSFRFSSESLLLASFMPLRPGLRLLDLGTGCGVIALGALCREPDMLACGVDIQQDMVDAARRNATLLGFAKRFRAVRRDLAAPELFNGESAPAELSAQGLSEQCFDLVLANPPYRNPKSGRLPRHPARQTALFAAEHTLDAFCAAARAALQDDGAFAVVYPARQENELTAALRRAAMTPVRILPVCTRDGDAPLLILAESKKDAPGTPAPPKREPALTLYEASGAGPRLSAQALSFCPFLDCNP